MGELVAYAVVLAVFVAQVRQVRAVWPEMMAGALEARECLERGETLDQRRRRLAREQWDWEDKAWEAVRAARAAYYGYEWPYES